MAPIPSSPRVSRTLRAACVAALAALALMTWQLFDPHVVPIIVAMSAGQVLGTGSFLLYLYAIVDDFRTSRKAVDEGGTEHRG